MPAESQTDPTHQANAPGRDRPGELRGDDARKDSIRLARFCVLLVLILAPKQKQGDEASQGKQANDQEVGRETPPVLGDPARKRHESGCEQVPQPSQISDH